MEETKLGIITDIHGNAQALKCVLEHLEQDGVDHIYCLGDMISIGCMTNEVLEIIATTPNITVLMGNHEQCVLSLRKYGTHPEGFDFEKRHHHWIQSHLDERYVKWLEELPRIVMEDIHGKSLLAMHYHIPVQKILLPLTQKPYSSVVEPTVYNLVNLFQDYQGDLILFGHHHPTQYLKTEDRIFFNPGSLGCHIGPFTKYGLVTISENAITVSTESVRYNKEAFIREMKKRNVPELGYILKIFYGEK